MEHALSTTQCAITEYPRNIREYLAEYPSVTICDHTSASGKRSP